VRRRGFSLLELLVVIGIISILSAVAILGVRSFRIKQRDSERQLQMNKFASLLEQYKNQTGAYVCGDDCNVGQDGQEYSIDCSTFGIQPLDTVYNGTSFVPNGPHEAAEESGFLNGGDCCNYNFQSQQCSGGSNDHRACKTPADCPGGTCSVIMP